MKAKVCYKAVISFKTNKIHVPFHVVTSEKINITSEKYRPVSQRGALLFFAMNSLHKMHTYYMFSLNSFIYFFLRGISTAGQPRIEAADSADDADPMDEEASVGTAASSAGEC